VIGVKKGGGAQAVLTGMKNGIIRFSKKQQQTGGKKKKEKKRNKGEMENSWEIGECKERETSHLGKKKWKRQWPR